MTTQEANTNPPDWDLEQLEVILEPAASWQLVVAGPGAGKSAVACQRVAYLVDDGVSPSRILLVSFTRTAVAELRNRIISYSVAGDRARSVRISTIDSHAWSLRAGFDDDPILKFADDSSYDLGIKKTVELFIRKNPELLDFMSRLEHIIIDEAQDVMGMRAELILQMLRSITPACGVTILADPAQAIYGFTTDSTDDSVDGGSFLDRLGKESPRQFSQRMLRNIHRIKNGALADVFLRTRKHIEEGGAARDHLGRVQRTIREACGNDVGVTPYENLAEFLDQARDDSMLVLFRRRAEVLFASSYCSNAGVGHRLRMSDLPVVVRPWLGWLLGETIQSILSRGQFDELWETRAALAAEPFADEQRDACWSVVHRLAAGTLPNSIDLVQLRKIVARSRPPTELCYPELGSVGPILGTIHASKGREADIVVLAIPPSQDGSEEKDRGEAAAIFEEGRVYYVGATRARKMLVTTGNSGARVGYLDSGRVYRFAGQRRAQMEIGRDGDLDVSAHLAWSDALTTQRALARLVGHVVTAKARAMPEHDYAHRISLERSLLPI